MCQHLLTLDAVPMTIRILVVHNKTHVTKEKATVTMITIARGIWFARKTIVFTTWDFHHGAIVALTHPKLQLDVITTTVLVLVVPVKTLATKAKEIVTTTLTVSVCKFVSES